MFETILLLIASFVLIKYLSMPDLDTSSGLPDRSKRDAIRESVTYQVTTLKITFITLPEDIHRRILEYLLTAKHACQHASNDPEFVVKYHYHTAIMRVNRQMDLLGQQIFQSNHFVLVSTNFGTLTTAITNHDVSMWQRNLACFKLYRMRLNIKVSSKSMTQGKYDFFMICLEQVHDFTQVLNILELANTPGFNLKFELQKDMSGSTVSLAVQKALLHPFTILQGADQKVSVSGAVNPSLAKSVKASMVSKVLWIRARAWAMYEAALRIKKTGDDAYACQNHLVAHKCWNDVLEFMDAVKASLKFRCKYDVDADENFLNTYKRLDITTWTNVANARLHLGWEEKSTKRLKLVVEEPYAYLTHLPYVIITDFAVLQFYRGVGFFALDKISDAQTSFIRARQFDAGSAEYKRAYDIASAWAQSGKKGKTKLRHRQELSKLIAMLPEEPLPTSLCLLKPTDASYNVERYILQRIGYTGNLLEHLQPTKSIEVDEEEGDEIAAMYNREIKEKDRCVCIGALAGAITAVDSSGDPAWTSNEQGPGRRDAGIGLCMMPGPQGPRSLAVRSWWPDETTGESVYGPQRWIGRVAPPGWENR
jgi:hypothetical protein